MEDLRSCLVSCNETEYDQDGISGRLVTVQKKARFHRFADDWTYTSEGQQIPFTVAIVELEDGHIEKVDPCQLKFTE